MEDNEIDLFEHYETLPVEVRRVLAEYAPFDNTWDNCRALEADLEPLGYTFEWDMSGIPFNLRKIIE